MRSIEEAIGLATQALSRLDDHIKVCDVRNDKVDAALARIGDTLEKNAEQTHDMHMQNIKNVQSLKSTAMWALITVLLTVLGYIASHLIDFHASLK